MKLGMVPYHLQSWERTPEEETDMPSDKKPPNPLAARAAAGITVPENKDPIWVKCRATQGCESNHAVVEMKKSIPFGGTAIHYKCVRCQKGFVTVI